MKTMIKAALAATVATGLFAAPAFAANSATTPFIAKAKIMKPLTLVNDTALDFGTITMGAGLTTSNVVIGRTDGSVPTSCGTNLNCVGGAAATFTVSGVAGQQLNISLSGVPAGLLNTADNTKTVAFTPDADTTVTLGTTGVDTGIGKFDIGGAITVLASTADGSYENTLNVTVAYQ